MKKNIEENFLDRLKENFGLFNGTKNIFKP